MEHRISNKLITFFIPPVVLSIVTILIYYPSLHYEFQFDDIANITKHFKIRQYEFRELFFSGSRWISYWLNSIHYKIGRFDPFSYRVGNLLIHTANGILVFFIWYLLLNKLNQRSFFKRNATSIAFLTSLLFLLHPVQTQTVSYVIQGQLEGLAALFSLSMALLFILIFSSKNLPLQVTLTVLYFVMAFFITGTKEIAIVAPALILLIDWFFIAAGSTKDLISRLWFHALSTTLILSLYIWLLKPEFFIELFGLKMKVANNLGNIITPDPNQMITPLHFFISQFKVIIHYLWIFIWPLHISVEYDWVLVKNFFSPDCLFPCMALFLGGFIIYKLLQKNPTNTIAFAALWFGIVIAPRSSIIPSPELLVDYKTYLASFGWLFILACGFLKIIEEMRDYARKTKTSINFNIVFPAFVIGIASLLGFGTYKRNHVWSSGVDFWGNIVENAPGKARAYNNYGVELSQKLGKFAESIPYFQHAIKMDKNYRDPYNNLAVAYAATHQLDKAIETLEKSLKINKFYPEAYNNIASFLIEKKNLAKAKEALNIALQLRPYYGKAYFNLGRIYLEEGELEKAHEAFKKACLEADLDNEAGYLGYAKSAMQIKKYDEAIFACKKVLECNPNNIDTEFSLGNAYYLAEKFDEATQVYNDLLRKNPQDSRIWYNLAETYFSAGNTHQALDYFSRLKGLPGIGPNLYIRIAACYEKLGMMKQAKNTLQELLAQKLEPHDKQIVQAAIQKLSEQYGIA